MRRPNWGIGVTGQPPGGDRGCRSAEGYVLWQEIYEVKPTELLIYWWGTGSGQGLKNDFHVSNPGKEQLGAGMVRPLLTVRV